MTLWNGKPSTTSPLPKSMRTHSSSKSTATPAGISGQIATSQHTTPLGDTLLPNTSMPSPNKAPSAMPHSLTSAGSTGSKGLGGTAQAREIDFNALLGNGDLGFATHHLQARHRKVAWPSH